jgi:hypothetical protein
VKAIIVTDLELNALLDRLELKKHEGPSSYEAQNLGMTQAMFEAAHRHFHYHVVRWIQEVGGEVKRS